MEETTIDIMADLNPDKTFLDEKEISKSRQYEFIKRAFDVISSSCACIILSPLFILTALAVFIEDRHNPIFSQIRVGKDGRLFKMYKFRSMYIGAEMRLKKLLEQNELDGKAFKMAKDPRITKVGRIIRKLSIDELPQLWNIIKGDMSIVGPRPALGHEVYYYNDFEMQRLKVHPGLTCYWQCSGRNNIGFDEWMELDVKYIKERSLWTDLKIIFKTIPAVLMSRGAE